MARKITKLDTDRSARDLRTEIADEITYLAATDTRTASTPQEIMTLIDNYAMAWTRESRELDENIDSHA